MEKKHTRHTMIITKKNKKQKCGTRLFFFELRVFSFCACKKGRTLPYIFFVFSRNENARDIQNKKKKSLKRNAAQPCALSVMATATVKEKSI